MKTIRTLLVSFDNNVPHHNISAFRGAIIEKVGRENLLFNHHIDDKRYLFRYPLIQYKSIHKNPAILCLGDGVDEIHKLFNKPTWEIDLKGKKIDLTIENLELKNHKASITKNSHSYSLYNWLALNQANFERYSKMADDLARIELLEKVLIGNILSFAKGIDWQIQEQIKVRITAIKKSKQLKYKNTHLMALGVDFISNVDLPSFIGLGKGASHGYGVILKSKRNN